MAAFLAPQILYEDNHLIAVNKPAGALVQGDKTGDKTLIDWIKNYIKKSANKPGNVYLGVIHRLDRPTSGVVIFAKTSKALTRMNALFKARETQKTYWAIVKNAPPNPEATLTHFLVRNPEKNKSFAYETERKEAKKAVLTYRISQQLNNYYLLDIELLTGRHHQIRTQLSAIGCPIKGDLKYGAERSNPDASIHLHARSLAFVHPVTKTTIELIADPTINDPLWKACLKFNE
ncbi:MAG: RluA family pseudouridine synthase [Flavobacteriaceae bacterium]|nr:RluA family pseudouridine synthase [Flavobacteriaceae bacterium]